jgi:hypothetical protein
MEYAMIQQNNYFIGYFINHGYFIFIIFKTIVVRAFVVYRLGFINSGFIVIRTKVLADSMIINSTLALYK